MTNSELVIQHTQKWLNDIVIGLNFCPFARREFVNQRIRYSVLENGDDQTIVEQVTAECERLRSDLQVETTLVIVPNGLADFEQYLNCLYLLDNAIIRPQFEGEFQLASFHPAYCFQGAAERDSANYTNRSPYPMFHLLREDSVSRAVDSHSNPEGIPEMNINKARQMGVDTLKKMLANCTNNGQQND